MKTKKPPIKSAEPRRVREFRAREQEILDISLTLFLSQGESSVTVEMIADAVGIAKGTIYKHFKSKYEIYLRLMIDYEQELANRFLQPEVGQDKNTLYRAYFEFRMKDPERYLLFDQLEARLVHLGVLPDMLEELYSIRSTNLERLSLLIQKRIDDDVLEDVPPSFHLGAAWALVHGAVALHQSGFYKDFIKDEKAFQYFLMDIGVRMGNKGQVRRKNI